MKNVTIVVAIVNNDNLSEIRNCLTSIDTNLFEVIVVSPKKYHKSIKELFDKEIKFSMPFCDQTSIRGLWRQGEEYAITHWVVFIQSSDILTAQLQFNLDQRCRKLPPYSNYKYNLQRVSIFLKRRTKYCHFWTGEPVPHVKCTNYPHLEENNFKRQGPDEFWLTPIGSLFHYGPESIFKAITTANVFIEEWAENLYHKSPDLDKNTVFKSALKESLVNFFRGLFFKKWIRDGFEGFVFAFLDLFITCLGYMRYHEKYIRDGRQLSDQLNSIQNILLVHVNGIGDVLMATPTLKNIKFRLPMAKIDVLTATSAKGVIEGNPYISNIYTISRLPSKREIKQKAKNLKSIKYDLIINLMSRNSTEKLVGLLTSKWKINNNISSRERFTDVTLGFKHDMSSFLQWELNLLKKIGFNPKRFEPEIFLTNEEVENARSFLHSSGFNLKKKMVVFHPFSSDPMRRWGIERFIDLAKSLNETYKYQILFIGSKNELDEAKAAISSQVPRAVLYDDTVRKTMGIINESNLLIGGDSGFTHVSVAVNVPTIVLQGPLAKDRPRDKDLYADTKNNFVFYKELLCRDILYTACGACSKRICFEFPVDTILDKALKILN